MIIYTQPVRPTSWQAAARAEEADDIHADLQERLRSHFLRAPLSGADLLALQRASIVGLGVCQCDQCRHARQVIARSLRQLPISELDRDRVSRLIRLGQLFNPRPASSPPCEGPDDSYGGQQP